MGIVGLGLTFAATPVFVVQATPAAMCQHVLWRRSRVARKSDEAPGHRY